MAKRKRGRRTKLTKGVLSKLKKIRGEGLLDRDLAHEIGVTPATFWNWKAKGEAAKSGIFREFFEALQAEEAALDQRLIKPWMRKVDDGDMKAIETAIKRHPRLRSEFKEEPVEHEVQAAGNINFIVPKEIASMFTEKKSEEEDQEEENDS